MEKRLPIILWLLLAATISVDAVVFSLQQQVDTRSTSQSLYVAELCDALCFSQISVACIYFVFGRRRGLAAALVMLVVFIAALVTSRMFDLALKEMLAFFGSYATVLVVLLWMLKHSPAFQQEWAGPSNRWQFTVAQLLGLTTVLAVLLALFRGSQLLHDIGSFVAADIIINSCLTVATVAAWAKLRRPIIRWTVIFGAAIACGFLDWLHSWFNSDRLLPVDLSLLPLSVANLIIQALVILLWLELGQIVQRSETSQRSRDRQTASLPPAGADAS